MVALQEARKVIGAAEKRATEVGQPMNIAVVDEGGNLVSHVRMDGAWIGSIDIAINKAFTSRAFDTSTKDLAQHSQSGGQFFGIHVSNHGRVMVFAGGIPLKTRWKDCRCSRSERRLWRAGSHCGRGRRKGVLTCFNRSEHIWQSIVELYTQDREKWKSSPLTFLS